MKQLWQYIKNPQENCPYDFSVRVMLLSVMLCLSVPLFFEVLTASVFVIAGVDLPAMTSDKSVLPLCFLIQYFGKFLPKILRNCLNLFIINCKSVG